MFGGGVIFKFLNSGFSPLWFVKYLMIFSLIAPAFYYVLRRKIMGAIVLLIMCGMNIFFYYSGIMEIPLNVNANNIVMLNYQYIFYVIGAYGALNYREFVETSTIQKRYIAGIVLVLLCLSYFLFIVKHGNVITNHFFRMVYIVGLWFVMDFVPRYKVKNWMTNSFFLYCSHLMILQCVQRVCDIVIGKLGKIQSVLYVLEYILLPIAVIVLLMIIAEFAKKYMPKIFGVMTGNRG